MSRLFDWFMVALIVANVAAVVIETVESISVPFEQAFLIFELVSVALFTIEYFLRLWVCTEHLPLKPFGPVGARLRFMVGPFSLIDLAAILPFYIALVFPAVDLRILRIFRLLRLLKLARYSPALASLGRVLKDERRALGAALLIMLALLVVSGTVMYHIEREVQPEKFGSIPQAMWWGMATLTTVGYGDVVPITDLGRSVGMVVMIFGLAMFALPIAIIASGFASEINRRDFVVTWGMVAAVPLFAGLDALSVSRVSNLLRSKVVKPETVVVRKGEPATAMYFIASGEVEVDLKPNPIRLGAGEFFGEMALLQKTERTATVRTITRTRFLLLDQSDFDELIDADAELRKAVTSVAEGRLEKEDDWGSQRSERNGTATTDD